MKPSIIIYNVPGGKTRFAERIAKFYGLRNGGTFSLQTVCSRGYIYFHSAEFASGMRILVKSFSEVAKEINAAIPLTPINTGCPSVEGEYFVSYHKHSEFFRRWWHGDRWSYAMLDEMTQGEKNLAASTRHDIFWRPYWRGLSQEPINTKE